MLKPKFMFGTIFTILLSVGLWGCDAPEDEASRDSEDTKPSDPDPESDSKGEPPSDSTEGTDEDSDTTDPDCGPPEEALVANEFGSALWGGEDVYLTVRYFHYFGDCEYRCISDEKTLMWRLDPAGNKTELFAFPAGRSALLDVTADGSRFAVSDSNSDALIVMDRDGKEIASFDNAVYQDISLSPDGTRALLKSLGHTATDAIWTMVTLEGGALEEMPVLTQAKPRNVSWSPDSNRLAYFDASKIEPPITILELEFGEFVQLDVGKTTNYKRIVWREDGNALYYLAQTSLELTASGIGTGWHGIDTAFNDAPVFVTGAVDELLSSSGKRTLYIEGSWLHVQDIVLEKSVYTVTGTGGNCC